MAFWLPIFMDISHTLDMTICVVYQLKNDSYCQGLYEENWVTEGTDMLMEEKPAASAE